MFRGIFRGRNFIRTLVYPVVNRRSLDLLFQVLSPDDRRARRQMKAQNRRGLVTMRDVAKATGFSPATVSIVLNDAPLARYIASGTKKKIAETAKRLGYRPNAMARFLRSKRSQSIGVMLTDVTDPFCTPILRGIENALYPLAYLPIFADAHNQRERFERYLEMLLERHVDGLIVVANWLLVDIHVLADLNKAEVPTVTIGWEIPGNRVSFAMVDNEAGGRMAIEHLHQLGHRRIAVILGPKRLIDSAPRWRGIQKFAQSVKLEIDPSLVARLPDVFDANASFEQGYRLTEELLQKKKKFSALIAFDDLTALGAIRALAKAGISVPEQCSVIGFDDIAVSSLSVPSLTTVRQPLETMGSAAVNIVMEAIKAGHENRDRGAVAQKLHAELVIRDSTQAI
jgi:LacI family transcriptional regulator